MEFNSASLVSFLVAVSFAAGLNVYATTAVLGILGRLHWFALPPGLGLLQNGWVIGAGVALFCLEFFADKIPLFDVVWNAVHTFVRLPIAALLAYRASSQLSPEMQLLVTAVSAGVATVAHGSKTAARVAVTPSPEPVSNIGLSAAEDVAAIGITWVATRHPYVAAGVAVTAVVAAGLFVRVLVRALRKEIAMVRERFGGGRTASTS